MRIKKSFLKRNNYKLSENQESKLDNILFDYCSQLWWNFDYDIDKKYVYKIIHNIAKHDDIKDN